MRFTIGIIPLDLTRGNVVEFALPVGAKIVHAYIAMVAKRVVVASAIGGVPSEPDLVPVLVMEHDPDAATERRRFVAVAPGLSIDTDDKPLRDYELVYVATIVNGQQPVVVYEMCDRAKVARAYREAVEREGVATIDSDRPAPANGEIVEAQ